MKKSEFSEAFEISQRLMSVLVTFPVLPGEASAAMRSAIGKFLANFSQSLDDRVLGTELFSCFELARAAGATINSMDRVRAAMFVEAPFFSLGESIIDAAIMFSFVEQSQIISRLEFRSRTDVDVLIDAMTIVIEDIKLNKADYFAVSDYQSFVGLAASLIQHLTIAERQLPRIVIYNFPVHYPALALANRIYADASRSDELILENRVVHPAFMQRKITALSD